MNLKTYMEVNAITQRKMAERLDITISHLRMLMFCKSSPSRKLAIKIEKVTNGDITKEEAIFDV
jgi:transcriptional regulator with XRE-family HTH domain